MAHSASGKIQQNEYFTTLDLEEVVRQIRALSEEARSGNLEDGNAEADPAYDALAQSLNLEQSISEYIDNLRGEGHQGDQNPEINPAAAVDAQSAVHSSSIAQRMTDEEFESRRASMSEQQKVVFTELQRICRAIFQSTEPVAPIKWFVTGGAGVGKSYIIEMMQELIRRIFPDRNECPVILTASTGVAAYNIGGMTLHTACKLPVEKGHGRRATAVYKPLEGELLEEQRMMWSTKKVRFLINDECSMVSLMNLQNASKRMGEFFGNEDLFGGVNVIMVGDFYQLQPVKAPFLFEGNQAMHLWRSNFKGIELTVIKDKEVSRNGSICWTKFALLRKMM